MDNFVNENEIWLNSDEACSLLNITRETLRRNCKAGKYISKTKKDGKYISIKVLLSSLPAKAQDEFYSKEEPQDKELDIEIYSNAPNWAKAKADKYLFLFDKAKDLKGSELEEFLNQWSKENPEQKISYSSFMQAKRKYKAEGVSALLASYGNNKGRTVIDKEFFEYFKSLYLKERGPSAASCWRTTWGYATRHYKITFDEFPSLSTFKRKIKAEIPQQAIYFARYGEAQWNRKYAIYLDRDYSNVVAGDCWVSDHAQMDVMVLDENGKPTAPWLTVWRDFKTSKWLAWDLYIGNPNSNRIFHTFYLAGIQYGKPLSVYIDNGKDYRAKDFAGGRSSCDVNKAAPMLKLLDIEARFALPYNAQSKPVERDFLKVKELFSRHLQGFRGGNVVERPEKLKNEIKNNNILKFADYKELFDDFIENVLNKMPSDGKNLKGKSPNQLWSEEFIIKRAVSKDELKLFCMRTSKAYAITRRGVKDGEIGVHYWADWMVPVKGEKVYLRRDPKAYQEAWVFRAKDEEYLGIASVAELTTNAFAETAVEKEHLQKAFAMKKREKKLVKEYIRTQNGYDSTENLENMKAAIDQAEFEDNAKVSRISKTKMSEVVAKRKQELQAQKPKKVRYSDCTTNTEGKRKIFLYESEKRRYERRLIND